MQRTIRTKMLNKLIYLLNNTDLETLEYEVKQQNIKSKYTLLFTIICETTVDIFYKSYNLKESREGLKKQLEDDYDTFLKYSEQFVDDEFLKLH